MSQGASPLPPLKDGGLLKTQAYIDGAWVDGSRGRFSIDNPADGGRIAEVANCGAEQTQHAIDAAERALPAWRAKTAKERSVLLRRWFDLAWPPPRTWRAS